MFGDSHNRENFGEDDRRFGQVFVENSHFHLIGSVANQSGLRFKAIQFQIQLINGGKELTKIVKTNA